MRDRTFMVTIKEYAPGREPDPLTESRIEDAIESLLDEDSSDGSVIVFEPVVRA